MHGYQHWKSRLGSVLLTLVPLFLVVPTIAAQDVQSTPDATDSRTSLAFEFYPAETGFGTYFSPTIEAGTALQMKVVLANTGDVPQDLRTYAVNAFTADGGGFGSAEYGVPPNDVTKWLNYPEEIYTIDVGTGIERTFSISVPPSTPPGQYITAIAGEHADAAAVEGSSNFNQKLRYTIPVFITVPGETTAGFEASNITATAHSGTLIVTVDLQNTGDVRVRPEGTIDIIGQDGALVASMPVAMESIYAHDQTTLEVGYPVVVEAGIYTVRVNLSDPESGERASAEINDVAIDPNATPEPTFVTIGSASITPAPSAEDVQFVTINAIISNIGPPVSTAQLSLIARVNGEEVERFPISQSLSLPSGETPITTRYIPATGWTSGEWSFELLLETVDPSGAAVVVGRQVIEGSITIP